MSEVGGYGHLCRREEAMVCCVGGRMLWSAMSEGGGYCHLCLREEAMVTCF
jgi:hypothetical protein